MPQPTGAQGDAGQQGNGTPPAAAAAAGAQGQPAAGDSGAQDSTQKAIDAIIARERTRAAAEVTALRTDFERQITELRSQIPAPKGSEGQQGHSAPPSNDGIAAARKPLEDALAAEQSRVATLEKSLVSTAIEAAAKDTLSPKTVALLADGQVRPKGNDFEVIDAQGQPRYTAKGPMTLGELVAEITAANDFLVPAAMRKGGNYQGSAPQGQQTTVERIAALEAEGKYAEATALKSSLLWSMPKPAAAAQ